MQSPLALTPPSPAVPAPLCLVVFLFGGNPRHKNAAPKLGRGVGGEGKG
jgi:hypothetical protein